MWVWALCCSCCCSHCPLFSLLHCPACPPGSDNAPARGREVFCFCRCHCLCQRVLPLTCLRFSMLGKEKNRNTSWYQLCSLLVRPDVLLGLSQGHTSASWGRSPVGLPLGWLECFKGEGWGKAVEGKGMCTLVRIVCSPQPALWVLDVTHSHVGGNSALNGWASVGTG